MTTGRTHEFALMSLKNAWTLLSVPSRHMMAGFPALRTKENYQLAVFWTVNEQAHGTPRTHLPEQSPSASSRPPS